MVMDALDEELHPFTVTVLVTVYIPGVLDNKVTAPVVAFNVNPAVDVNVPATAFVPKVIDTIPSFEQ